MSVTVHSHATSGPNDELYVKTLVEEAADLIRSLERSPQMFNMTLSQALMCTQARAALDPTASQRQTWEAYVTATQVGSALFAAAGITAGTVECNIDHTSMEIPATGPQRYANAGNWITAFWLAMVCRDHDRMTQLCKVPISLLRESGAEFDEYIYHWVDTLQAYWLEQPGLVDKLITTIEMTYPQVAQIAAGELMDMILYQPIDLFHKFVRKDPERFNEALEKALQLHKEYWTDTEERAMGVGGLVALGPLAMTCLAYDAGFPIEVDSHYLPKDLVLNTHN